MKFFRDFFMNFNKSLVTDADDCLPPEFRNIFIPKEWTPPADMRRIHLHWTAGTNIASSLDREHYHFLIQFIGGKPEIVLGHHPVHANQPPLREGEYAAHTRRANSHAIGIGICGMHGATDRPLHAGGYPITEDQWDHAMELIASLSQKYCIDVSNKTILTHAEVQDNLGIRQNGKWDIAFLPFHLAELSHEIVGAKMRDEVSVLISMSNHHIYDAMPKS